MWLVWTAAATTGSLGQSLRKTSLATFEFAENRHTSASEPETILRRQTLQIRDFARWHWNGARSNEPCFEKRPQGALIRKRFGPVARRFPQQRNCPAGPVRKRAGPYPGVKTGRARGTNLLRLAFQDAGRLLFRFIRRVSSACGLFPQPENSTRAAKDNWDAEKYYTDENYYKNPALIKPYPRRAWACGFCHGRAKAPFTRPADPSNIPQWSDLNSTVGAQYLWMDPGGFVYYFRQQEGISLFQPCEFPLSARHDGITLRWSPPTTSTIRPATMNANL